MTSITSTFLDAIKDLFRLIVQGIEDLFTFSRNHILVIYRKKGKGLYSVNAGIALLMLVVIDLLFPAMVILGFFAGYILGVRCTLRSIY
ncbi:MAG: hypothetical protein JW971_02175 [Synergistales bacterium]|nr:hypothetical protein [Synergistales bacterium]